MKLAGVGLVALVLSVVLAAIFGDRPQWMDVTTTVGFLGGVMAYGVGLLWWFRREMGKS